VSDLPDSSAPFRPAFGTLRSTEFDASIFDRAAESSVEDRSDPPEDLDDEEPPAQREGLPPGFSMRHDTHYVEELVSRNRASRVGATPTAESDRPRNGQHAREARPTFSTAAACAEVGRSLDAIGACLHLFSDASRPTPERVALDLIGGEVCRATWLVQSLALLDDDPPVGNSPVVLEQVVRRVLRGLVPGWPGAGATLEIDANARELRASGDQALLGVAVAGMVMALQAVAERVESAVVEVRIREEAGRAIVEATQEAVRMPASWRARFLDATWSDRPGGRRVAVALAASQRVAELHLGTLNLSDAKRGGSRLVLSLPRA
jgi:hypothetical protein